MVIPRHSRAWANPVDSSFFGFCLAVKPVSHESCGPPSTCSCVRRVMSQYRLQTERRRPVPTLVLAPSMIGEGDVGQARTPCNYKLRGATVLLLSAACAYKRRCSNRGEVEPEKTWNGKLSVSIGHARCDVQDMHFLEDDIALIRTRGCDVWSLGKRCTIEY